MQPTKASRTFAITALLALAACGRGPDIDGTLTLGDGVSPPEQGVLIIDASPITRLTERMSVSPLRLDVDRLTFPFDFTLHGNGKEPDNRSWLVTARVQVDPTQALYEAQTSLTFVCDEDEDADDCEAPRATVVLTQ